MENSVEKDGVMTGVMVLFPIDSCLIPHTEFYWNLDGERAACKVSVWWSSRLGKSFTESMKTSEGRSMSRPHSEEI